MHLDVKSHTTVSQTGFFFNTSGHTTICQTGFFFRLGRQWPYHGLTDRVRSMVTDVLRWKSDRKNRFVRPWYGHWRRIQCPIFPWKGYIHFCRPTAHSLKNGHVPPKLFFAVILENIVSFFVFFLEKIVIWKIFKTLFLKKKFFLIFVARQPLPFKMVMPSHKCFSQFFNINWRTSTRCSFSKVYSFERKFYGE